MISGITWYIKPTAIGAYVQMPQPVEYDIDVEDLDNNSYRAITTGNLIDSVISKNWSKCKFVFEGLSTAQAYDLLDKVSVNPIYAKIENPIWSSGFIEAQFRCSKKTIQKMKVRSDKFIVTINLVQKNKITGM